MTTTVTVLADTLALSEERPNERALVTDLDGTLLQTDVLFEGFLALLRAQPWKVILLPWWLLRGRAFLKASLAECVQLNYALLPYRQEVLREIERAKASGRRVILCTAANETIARGVAEYLGCFDGVFASSRTQNLNGENKARLLAAEVGQDEFDYIGNSRSDIPAWRISHETICVGTPPRITDRDFARVIPIEPLKRRDWFKVFRVHHWAKNLLLVVPLLTSHRISSVVYFFPAVLAFLALSLVASAIYIANDLIDLDADRAHPVKRRRPFACGRVSILSGIAMAVLLLAVGLAIGSAVGPAYQKLLTSYVVITSLYTLWLKRLLLVDVIALASLHTLRILAGGAAFGVPVSVWLLAFSMFAFFSLALIKRCSELRLFESVGPRILLRGRAYMSVDLQTMTAFGVASGLCSALVLALYVNSPDVTPLYHDPQLLLMLCPLSLYTIARLWILAGRGEVQGDPIVFAIRDRISYVSVALGLLVMFLAAKS